MKPYLRIATPVVLILAILVSVATNKTHAAAGSHDDDVKAIAALDTQHQAAVQKNDAATMAKLLDDNFILVISNGSVFTKDDLLKEARAGQIIYERQDDTQQTLRVWGDTGVITAKLYLKGTDNGKPFEYSLWFSDTYARTPSGWKYVFGQAACHEPKTS
jgi:ketosteroid isomerase-like protein